MLDYNNKKILLVYSSAPTANVETKLYNSFIKICQNTTLLFTEDYSSRRHSLYSKFLNKLKLPHDFAHANYRIINWVKFQNPDLVFIVKGNVIWPSTLKFIKSKGCKIVSWSNDDMYAWHGRSLYFSLGIKYYDLVVTQKSYNLNSNELPSLGAKKLLFQNKAYDPALHFPCEKEIPGLVHDVLFIGTYEEDRLAKLRYLANNGIIIHIYGWGKEMKNENKNLIFHNRHLYGEDFRSAITNAKICLNFLRKKNRDLQTSRSIEIPACRGFMISEQSNEHIKLFREDKEAVFFKSKDDLFEKIKYYLENERLRKEIAQKGYERCLYEGYSFDTRIREILNFVFELK